MQRELKDKVVAWSNEEEKRRMKQRIKIKYGFQKCVGIIDGTLIVFHHMPLRYGDSTTVELFIPTLVGQVRRTITERPYCIICPWTATMLFPQNGWKKYTTDITGRTIMKAFTT